MDPDAKKKRSISVDEFFRECPSELKLELPNCGEVKKSSRIDSPEVQRLGLALSGYTEYLRKGRIQMIGDSEVSFLGQLESAKRIQALEGLPFESISCIIVMGGLAVPNGLAEFARISNTPVFTTSQESSSVFSLVTTFLKTALAEQSTIHGVFLEMYELGVLITGESGIGKSECALELILKGHRLIADDAVKIIKNGNKLEAESAEITKDLLEIRGLGIINVREVFGENAAGNCRKVDLLIELRRRENEGESDRLGTEMRRVPVMGTEIPAYILHLRPGRSVSALIETAVRIYLLNVSGKRPTREFIRKYNAAVSGNS
ncbi:MAG: HPr(Ser) kinase/phosphatase [Pyrinomonadaceae bacterium]